MESVSHLEALSIYQTQAIHKPLIDALTGQSGMELTHIFERRQDVARFAIAYAINKHIDPNKIQNKINNPVEGSRAGDPKDRTDWNTSQIEPSSQFQDMVKIMYSELVIAHHPTKLVQALMLIGLDLLQEEFNKSQMLSPSALKPN